MESASTPTPTAFAQSLFYFPSEHNIPGRPEYGGKYQHHIDVHGEVLPTPRSTTTAATTSK